MEHRCCMANIYGLCNTGIKTCVEKNQCIQFRPFHALNNENNKIKHVLSFMSCNRLVHFAQLATARIAKMYMFVSQWSY